MGQASACPAASGGCVGPPSLLARPLHPHLAREADVLEGLRCIVDGIDARHARELGGLPVGAQHRLRRRGGDIGLSSGADVQRAPGGCGKLAQAALGAEHRADTQCSGGAGGGSGGREAWPGCLVGMPPGAAGVLQPKGG